jgi:hypothetical protein
MKNKQNSHLSPILSGRVTKRSSPPRSPRKTARKSTVPFANNWDHANEKMIRHLEEQCNGYKYMYTLMRKRYKQYAEISTISSGILGAIIATIGLVSTGNKEAATGIGIASIVLGFFVSVISILKSIYKSEEVQATSITASAEYAKLSNSIVKQLLLPAYKRDDCVEFIQHINDELNSCSSKFPVIDSAIENEYKKRFKTDHIFTYTPSSDYIVGQASPIRKHHRTAPSDEEVIEMTEIQTRVESSDDSPNFESDLQFHYINPTQIPRDSPARHDAPLRHESPFELPERASLRHESSFELPERASPRRSSPNLFQNTPRSTPKSQAVPRIAFAQPRPSPAIQPAASAMPNTAQPVMPNAVQSSMPTASPMPTASAPPMITARSAINIRRMSASNDNLSQRPRINTAPLHNNATLLHSGAAPLHNNATLLHSDAAPLPSSAAPLRGSSPMPLRSMLSARLTDSSRGGDLFRDDDISHRIDGVSSSLETRSAVTPATRVASLPLSLPLPHVNAQHAPAPAQHANAQHARMSPFPRVSDSDEHHHTPV